jgi:predicted RNA binding protein YcfA (HicA-like mRNA interferase family)
MINPLPPREIYRKFRALGFEGPFQGGKHYFMRKGQLKVRVPNPHGQDISRGLIREILRQANITAEDWEKA